MPDSSAYFPSRMPGDALDIAPLIRLGLQGNDDGILIVFDGQAITRGALRAMVAGFSRSFEQRGLSKGDRVAAMLSNSPQHIALVYALIVSGLVWIPINTKLNVDGLQYILQHAHPSLLISEADFLEVLKSATVPVSDVGTLATVARDGEVPATPLHHSDTLCIIYTSGTTGPPKGVQFTHRMMRIASESVLLVAGISAADRVFLWEPLCHIGGAQMLVVPFLVPASLFVVPRFSASRFWVEWTKAQATHLHYLGGILDILVRLPETAQPTDAIVRVAWGAGVAAASWNAIRDRLGCELRECYGMTECSSFATVNTSGKPGSIGKPLPWFTIELLGEDGHPVPQGDPGEIVLASDLEGVFLPGYLDNPQATAHAVRGGRLHTGDLARQDADGDYVFVGRRTDRMRVRGENVSAWEVERVFARHPAIEASAAVGIAGEIGEQDILLYVQFKKGEQVDWTTLSTWAEQSLATFQRPRFYKAIAQFPLTPSQRIQKHQLPRESASAWDRQKQA